MVWQQRPGWVPFQFYHIITCHFLGTAALPFSEGWGRCTSVLSEVKKGQCISVTSPSGCHQNRQILVVLCVWQSELLMSVTNFAFSSFNYAVGNWERKGRKVDSDPTQWKRNSCLESVWNTASLLSNGNYAFNTRASGELPVCFLIKVVVQRDWLALCMWMAVVKLWRISYSWVSVKEQHRNSHGILGRMYQESLLHRIAADKYLKTWIQQVKNR